MYHLSENINKFIKQCQLSKPMEIIYDSTINAYGKLEINNPLKYEIWINPDKVSENNFDYFYTHEYLHAVQNDNNFPLLICGNPMEELQYIANLISSLVADINIMETLNGLNLNVEKDIIDIRISQLKDILNHDKLENTNSDSATHIFLLSTQLALSYFEYDKGTILNLLSEYSILSNINYTTNSLIQIIEQHGYMSKQQCLNIFEDIQSKLLTPFGLGSYYTIRKQQ